MGEPTCSFGDMGEGGMEFIDDPFGAGIELDPVIENEVDIADNTQVGSAFPS